MHTNLTVEARGHCKLTVPQLSLLGKEAAPIRLLSKGERIEGGRDVAASLRVVVLARAPRARHAVGLFNDDKVRDVELALELHAHGDAADAGAHDDASVVLGGFVEGSMRRGRSRVARGGQRFLLGCRRGCHGLVGGGNGEESTPASHSDLGQLLLLLALSSFHIEYAFSSPLFFSPPTLPFGFVAPAFRS